MNCIKQEEKNSSGLIIVLMLATCQICNKGNVTRFTINIHKVLSVNNPWKKAQAHFWMQSKSTKASFFNQLRHPQETNVFKRSVPRPCVLICFWGLLTSFQWEAAANSFLPAMRMRLTWKYFRFPLRWFPVVRIGKIGTILDNPSIQHCLPETLDSNQNPPVPYHRTLVLQLPTEPLPLKQYGVFCPWRKCFTF